MAKSRPSTYTPMVRALVRGGVREGIGREATLDRVAESFPNANRSAVSRLFSVETNRQSYVDRIMSRDKRRNVDLRKVLQCPAGSTGIRVRITVHYTDETTGNHRQFGHTTTLQPRGRLADLLNPALAEAVVEAQGMGYQIPTVTSAMTSGGTHYRLEYAECV